jgi:hypothetical protein
VKNQCNLHESQKAEYGIVEGILILRRCLQERLSREYRRMDFHGLWSQDKPERKP